MCQRVGGYLMRRCRSVSVALPLREAHVTDIEQERIVIAQGTPVRVQVGGSSMEWVTAADQSVDEFSRKAIAAITSHFSNVERIRLRAAEEARSKIEAAWPRSDPATSDSD